MSLPKKADLEKKKNVAWNRIKKTHGLGTQRESREKKKKMVDFFSDNLDLRRTVIQKTWFRQKKVHLNISIVARVLVHKQYALRYSRGPPNEAAVCESNMTAVFGRSRSHSLRVMSGIPQFCHAILTALYRISPYPDRVIAGTPLFSWQMKQLPPKDHVEKDPRGLLRFLRKVSESVGTKSSKEGTESRCSGGTHSSSGGQNKCDTDQGGEEQVNLDEYDHNVRYQPVSKN